jgi:hypothetical protein
VRRVSAEARAVLIAAAEAAWWQWVQAMLAATGARAWQQQYTTRAIS